MGFGNTTNPTPGHLSLPDGGGWLQAGGAPRFFLGPASNGVRSWEVGGEWAALGGL